MSVCAFDIFVHRIDQKEGVFDKLKKENVVSSICCTATCTDVHAFLSSCIHPICQKIPHGLFLGNRFIRVKIKSVENA